MQHQAVRAESDQFLGVQAGFRGELVDLFEPREDVGRVVDGFQLAILHRYIGFDAGIPGGEDFLVHASRRRGGASGRRRLCETETTLRRVALTLNPAAGAALMGGPMGAGPEAEVAGAIAPPPEDLRNLSSMLTAARSPAAFVGPQG